LRPPSLEEVDAARVEHVGGDGKVEAAIRPASFFGAPQLIKRFLRERARPAYATTNV
jgi:hypothetical protein